jgi:hypothetical protein
MTHAPPLDQRIVDEFFQLENRRGSKGIAWLYGMIATYGTKPEDLEAGYHWDGTSIVLTNKKRPIRPLHPQWVFLFQLKEKQPHKMQGRWESLYSSLYRAIAHQQIRFNITDLLLAYRLRKSYYRQLKQQQASVPACVVAS